MRKILVANIYGVPESVQEILKSCPDGTIDFEDINRNHQDIIAALHRSNEEFFEQLTVRIQTE
jgi:hypothetical protein